MKYLNARQLQEAMDKAAKESHRNYLIIKTLAESGLRVSELTSLTPQNINFDERVFHIKGKGGKIRNVDIPRDLAQLLRSYVKEKKITSRNPIFCITRSQVFRITKDVSDHSPHAYRHSYAIALLRRTKNIRYVQKQLGHAKLSATEIYLQFLEYDEEKAKLDSLLEQPAM